MTDEGQFIITTGRGGVHRIFSTTLAVDHSPLILSETRCDNHLCLASLS